MELKGTITETKKGKYGNQKNALFYKVKCSYKGNDRKKTIFKDLINSGWHNEHANRLSNAKKGMKVIISGGVYSLFGAYGLENVTFKQDK